MTRAERAERDAEIVRRARSGEAYDAIALEYGIAPKRVSQIALKAGYRRDSSWRLRLPEVKARAREGSGEAKRQQCASGRLIQDPERDRQIVHLVERGLSFAEVSAKIGVTRNVVAGAVWRAKRRRIVIAELAVANGPPGPREADTLSRSRPRSGRG